MINSIDIQNEYEFNVYPKRDLVLAVGKNARVWDDQGKEYIDCVAGHGVANIGHCNEAVVRAVSIQAGRLITCSNTFYNDVRAQLLKKLVGIAPDNISKAFLCNSGAESIEAAIKIARFTTGRTDFICAMKSFHGRTMGAMSATFNPEYKKAFEPVVPGFSFAPFNNFEKLAEKVTGNTAAVFLEIVQGEGGVHIGDREYFQKVGVLCKEKNILLIIDEVQTGFCRTGKMLACEHYNLRPDIICLAKGIAGGLPMGAVLCADNIKPPMGKHGSTFGGGPLVCAASLAAIGYMQAHKLDKQAAEKGAYFLEKFKEHNLPKVRQVRGLGLMIGIELKEKSKPYIIELMNQGVLTLPAGSTVIRLLPPLTIGYDDLDTVIEKLVEVLK
jgi:predicted acetylornithine/succinylornithine family transaminase